MDKEVLKDLYKRAVSKGYTKTLEDFALLINSDEEVLLDNYNYVKEKGYAKPIEDFFKLFSLKKIQKSLQSSRQKTFQSLFGIKFFIGRYQVVFGFIRTRKSR